MRRSRPIDVNAQIQRLEKKHTLLKARVRELDERMHLTAMEERERAELKKQKLVTKDALFDLRTDTA